MNILTKQYRRTIITVCIYYIKNVIFFSEFQLDILNFYFYVKLGGIKLFKYLIRFRNISNLIVLTTKIFNLFKTISNFVDALSCDTYLNILFSFNPIIVMIF